MSPGPVPTELQVSKYFIIYDTVIFILNTHNNSATDNVTTKGETREGASNLAIADWFFYERITKFVEIYYVDLLGATDYWLRFEWQHRGSPHVRGLAWLPNVPDKLLTLTLPHNCLTLWMESLPMWMSW